MNAKALYYVGALYAIMLVACGTPSPFPLSFPSSKNTDDRIVGNWKLMEDTNKYNFYEVTKRDMDGDFQYHVRFFDKGGINPSYEASIFFSNIGDIKFLNVPYFQKIEGKDGSDDWNDRGYFFVRILQTDKDFNNVTTATVNSSSLTRIGSAFLLRTYMNLNVNNPHIYSDTVHFYKVNQTTAELRKPY